MLPLTEFKKPLVTFRGGAPPHYKRKYPPLNQTFPLPPTPKYPAIPKIPPENIKIYPVDKYGRRLF